MRTMIGFFAAILLVATFAAARVDVSIVGMAFVPPTVLIPLGETVRWTNNDPIPHTATSDTGVWDSGNIAPGAFYERVFSAVGGFKYHCIYHPMMKGTINAGNNAVAPASMGRVKALFR